MVSFKNFLSVNISKVYCNAKVKILAFSVVLITPPPLIIRLHLVTFIFLNPTEIKTCLRPCPLDILVVLGPHRGSPHKTVS